MTRDEQEKLTDDFIMKLKSSVINGSYFEYKLKFASSTKPFFSNFCVYRYEIKEYIKEITTKNYHYGLSDDEDSYPGDVWEFGFDLFGQEIYIKFRIHKTYISCFKIHPGKKPMTYPFR